MAKKHDMPKELYIYREVDGDLEWFNAYEEAKDIATEESRDMYLYKLVKAVKVRKVTNVIVEDV